MALLHIRINALSRSAGRSAPAAAAYRAGERIRDERTGVLHNHARRRDVTHSEIFLPSTLAADAASWARDRARLWNAAEAVEQRRDARVAREYQVALPHELSPAQRLQVAREFSRELADRYNVAVDLAIHEPRPGGDPRNYHAHLLTTTREISAAGLGAKTGLDMAYPERLRRGLPAGLRELVAIRERWTSFLNDAFRAAGLEQRLDHRSFKAQGIDREPRPHIPLVAYQMERRGLRSEVAERIRERYRQRVAERVAARAARAAGESATPSGPGGAEAAAALAAPAQGVAALEELRQRSREAWLQLRREALANGSPGLAQANELPATGKPARDQSASACESRSDAADRDMHL
jgi:ATP-dependent exoDNAse (exonuclease V) alpha subunit